MKRVNVQYFAIFREQSGLSEEVVETSAVNGAELYAHLASQYGFSLPVNLVRLSVNLEFRQLDSEIRDGDSVVFIPPVAGG